MGPATRVGRNQLCPEIGYKTKHSDETKEPKEWSEKLRFRQFKLHNDDKGYVPELTEGWLNPQ